MARRPLAALLAALPRAWVAALLVVAALDLAVVAGTGARTAEAATGIAPLVAGLAPDALVTDGVLVADDVALVTDAHALLVDRAAEAASATAPAGRDALVLAGDGVALLVGGDRWTVTYAGSLAAADLHALLAGWQEAQRGTALLAAVLTGALTAALATAVLALGARFAGRLAGRRGAAPALPARDALAWWACSLAVAATGAAVVVLGTGGAAGRTPTLVATLLAATAGVCALAGAAARAAPALPSPPAAPPPASPPAPAAATAPPAGPEPAAAP